MKFLGPSMQDMGGGSSSGINLIDFFSLNGTTISTSFTADGTNIIASVFDKNNRRILYGHNALVSSGGSMTFNVRIDNPIFYERNLTPNDFIIKFNKAQSYDYYRWADFIHFDPYIYSIVKTSSDNSYCNLYIPVFFPTQGSRSTNFGPGYADRKYVAFYIYFDWYIIDRG